MPYIKNIKGRRFGKLTALFPTKEREPTNGIVKWFCRCDCGNFTIVNGNNLQTGNTAQCKECNPRKFGHEIIRGEELAIIQRLYPDEWENTDRQIQNGCEAINI